MCVKIVGDCVKGVFDCDHRFMAAAVKIGLHPFLIVGGLEDVIESVFVLDEMTTLTEGIFHGGKPALRYQISVARHFAEKIQVAR